MRNADWSGAVTSNELLAMNLCDVLSKLLAKKTTSCLLDTDVN